MEEAVELVDIVGGVASLGEELLCVSDTSLIAMKDTYGIDDDPPWAALDDHLCLGLDRPLVL